MSEPGYITIPLDAADRKHRDSGGGGGGVGGGAAVAGDGSESTRTPRRAAVDRWKFGRSSNRKHLSPVVVSRTLHGILGRIEVASVGTEHEFRLLPFAMENDRSPVTGSY